MRLIGCTYDDYESNGGLHDAISDDTGDIIVFWDEKSCVSFAEHHGCSTDNLDIWGLNTLKLISRWRCKRIWNESHKLASFTFIER